MTESRGKNAVYREKIQYGSAYMSMWGLLARGSFYKVLAAVTAMAAVEGIFFYCGRQALYSRKGVSNGTISQILNGVKMHPIFLVTLGIAFFILLWTEKRLDGKSGNTMMRLRVSPNHFYVIKAIYNILCLLLVFAAQILLALGMIWICKKDMGQNAPQTYFFAFYGNRFLHCLLPMAEMGKWVRNGLMLTAFGMEAAGMKGKSYYMPIARFLVAAYWFRTGMGMNILDVLCDIVFILIIGKEIFAVKYAGQD